MEDQNNFYYKPAYKCGICGNTYDSVQKRMNCEMACVRKQQEEEKAAAEAKKKKEQEARKSEIDLAVERLHKLMTEYVKDYGHYEYSDDVEDANFYLPSRVWSYFWN